MKLKHLFFSTLAAMALAACSSEAEEIKPAEKASTATLQLDMTGQYGTGSTDQTRALSLDGSEYPRFIHEEGVTDWSTHCFIRNEEGTVQFYALVDWNATTNEDGTISLHIKNSKLELQNSAGSDVTATETLPKAGERWYIAGIAGGGVLGATNSNVSFASNSALDIPLKPHQIRVPLSFGWTRFTIPSNAERAPQIVVQFQPQGALFSVYVNNKTNVNQVPLNASVKVTSNVLSPNGLFDYALEADRATYAVAPKWTFTNETAVYETFSRSINIDQNIGANCYIWAMPRTTVPAEGFGTTVGIGGYTYFAEGSSSEKPAAITKTFQSGNTYMVKGVDVYRPYLPHEFLAEYNVAPDGTSFATTHANGASGFWTWADALANFGWEAGFTVDGIEYHLPNEWEMRGLFPDHSTYTVTAFSSVSSADDVQETIEIQGYRGFYTASYRGTADGIAYGRRLAQNADNSRLTATRYAYIDNPNEGGGKMLKVTFRYLGVAGASTTIDQIANEEYWQSNNTNDVSFLFPAAGYRASTGSTVINKGTAGYYWLSTRSRRMIFVSQGVAGSTMNTATPASVRLFKNSVE